jgi:hypothetical protein
VPTPRNPAWAELIQLAPVLSLAMPFIIRGEVDLGRASQGFLVGALLTLPVSAFVVYRKHVLNPILIGTGLWLLVGAYAFNAQSEVVSAWLTQARAFGLFVSILAVGLATTFLSPQGFIGCVHNDTEWLRRASLLLLAFSALAATVAYWLRGNVRLGGGLPFVALNVLRRVVINRKPSVQSAAS